MAGEKSFKQGEAVPIVYQAPGAQSGLAGVIAEIILPDGTKDVVNFPDVALTEVLTTGSYQGAFTPNAQGEWLAICHKADGSGKVVKRYSVGAHNIHTVGENVNAVGTTVAAVGTAVVGVDGKVTTVDGKVDTVNGKIDAIQTAVNGLDSPAMVS